MDNISMVDMLVTGKSARGKAGKVFYCASTEQRGTKVLLNDGAPHAVIYGFTGTPYIKEKFFR
jgi:hypothetical protein